MCVCVCVKYRKYRSLGILEIWGTLSFSKNFNEGKYDPENIHFIGPWGQGLWKIGT